MAESECDSNKERDLNKRPSPRKSADWSRGPRAKFEDGERRVELEAVLLGAPRVGKTAIAQQFLWRKFVEVYKPTVEEFDWIEYECGDDDSRTFTLKLIDTSGGAEFLAMRDLYIRKSDAFVLVHSPDVEGSFDEVRRLREAIAASNTKNAPVILVRNKSDLPTTSFADAERETILRYAVDTNCVSLSVTATDYDSVEQIFRQLFSKSPYGKEAASNRLKKRRQSMPANVRSTKPVNPNAGDDQRSKNGCVVC